MKPFLKKCRITYKKYIEGVIFLQIRNDFIEKLLDRAQIKEGMRVLDIGCATGEVT